MTEAEAIRAWEEANEAPMNWNNASDRAAIFLLLAVTRNNSATSISRDSRLTYDECRAFKTVAKSNGIIVGRRLAVDWLDQETGGIAFMMDVLCCSGLMERVSA